VQTVKKRGFDISFTRIAALVVSAVGMGLLCSGCDNPIITDGQAREAALEISSQVEQGENTLLSPTRGAELEQINVYVDRSASMRPYSEVSATPYHQLLDAFGNLFGDSASFYGFGFPEQDQGQVVQPARASILKEASSYYFQHNDYAALFDSLTHDGSAHIVISDGVQSDATSGNRFSGIVESVGSWIEQGGVFALITYRVPYRGQYFHEMPQPGSVQYECSDRPLHLFGFFPSEKLYHELVEVLKADGLVPSFQLPIGVPALQITPMRSTGETSQGQRGERIMSAFNEHGAANIRPVYSGRVVSEREFVPLHFGVRLNQNELPWDGLTQEQIQTVLQQLDPTLRAWRISGVREEDLRLVEIPNGQLETQNPSVKVRSADSSRQAQITFPARRPDTEGRQRYFAWSLDIRPSAVAANNLVPESMSTTNDSISENCSRTLNLHRMLGTVLREKQILGSSLLVTEWN